MQPDESAHSGTEDAEQVLRVLDTPVAKRLGDYLLIEEDLKLAAVWFYLASADDQKGCCDAAPIYRDACVHAGAISYRRCFNSGTRTRLKAEAACKIAEPNGAALHPEIILIANKMIAHSEPQYEKAWAGAKCVFHRKKNLHAFVDAYAVIYKTRNFGDEQIRDFGFLCGALVADHVRPQIEEMRIRLREELCRMPAELLFGLPEAGVATEDDPETIYNPVNFAVRERCSPKE